MKDVFLAYAKYGRDTDKAVLEILGKLSNEDREKDRGSYFGSISGVVIHLTAATAHFLGMLKDSVAHNAAAVKALEPLAGITPPKGPLSEAQWKQLAADLASVDAAAVNFVTALEEGDFTAPVKVDWFEGNPPSVPLYFMLSQLSFHNTHHRGQISQILDELKIDNDYSGLDPSILLK
jgi:uncharacterized damage-inducible protein DinB